MEKYFFWSSAQQGTLKIQVSHYCVLYTSRIVLVLPLQTYHIKHTLQKDYPQSLNVPRWTCLQISREMLSGTKLNPGIWVFCSSRALTLHRLKTEQLDCVLPSQKCPWNRETYSFNSGLELKLFLPITTRACVEVGIHWGPSSFSREESHAVTALLMLLPAALSHTQAPLVYRCLVCPYIHREQKILRLPRPLWQHAANHSALSGAWRGQAQTFPSSSSLKQAPKNLSSWTPE